MEHQNVNKVKPGSHFWIKNMHEELEVDVHTSNIKSFKENAYACHVKLTTRDNNKG